MQALRCMELVVEDILHMAGRAGPESADCMQAVLPGQAEDTAAPLAADKAAEDTAAAVEAAVEGIEVRQTAVEAAAAVEQVEEQFVLLPLRLPLLPAGHNIAAIADATELAALHWS